MELFNHVINIKYYIEDFIKDKEDSMINKNYNNILKYITNNFTITSFIYQISKAINNIIDNLGDDIIILFLKNTKIKIRLSIKH